MSTPELTDEERAFDLRRFSRTNLRRCVETFKHTLDSWSLAEWTNAVAGEAGEAANVAKKLLRFRDGVAGNVKADDKDPTALKERLARELADVIIYCDLAIQAAGRDTATVLAEVFNAKSRQLGSDIFVAPDGGEREALQRIADRIVLGWRCDKDDGTYDCAECRQPWDAHEHCAVGDLLAQAAALGIVPRSP